MLRNVGLRKSVEQPVLDLNFAASQIGSNGAPDSRIDFSRGTNAWFVDSDGLVKKSPHNLQVYSQDFDNAAWTKARSGITATNEIAPDGSATASRLSEDNTSGNTHIVFDSPGLSSDIYTFTVFAKRVDRSIAIRTDMGTNGVQATTFNLSTDEGGIFGQSPHHDSSIEAVGNGWFRCTATFKAADSVTNFVLMLVKEDELNRTVYAGEGSASPVSSDPSVLIWGAQISQHTTLPVDNPYIKTEGSAVYAAKLDHDASWFMSEAQEQNLLEYSEMLDDSYWEKTRVTVTANAIAAPDGTNTAELLQEDSNGSTHFIRQNTDVQITNGKTYTFSGYLKEAGRTKVRVRFIDTQGVRDANVDLSAGTISNISSFDSVALTDEGDGWFRFAVTEAAGVTGIVTVQFNFLDDSGNTSYTGDGSSGFYAWGLQFEVGSTASTYHRTEGAPYYGPGATPKGLLIEEARTNLEVHSEDLSATGWATTNSTVTTNQVLAPDGTTTADLQTRSSTSASYVRDNIPKSASAITYTTSVFVKKSVGDYFALRLQGTYPARIDAIFNISTGAVHSLAAHGAFANQTSSIEDYGNGWFRCVATCTSDTHTEISLLLSFSTNATVVDGIDSASDSAGFVWGVQVEEGSFPTSYIQTTGTTLTRNADVATMGPTTGGTELVTNGTFDTDATGWSNLGGKSSLSVSSGQLIVDVVDATVGFVASVSATNVVPGRRYRLSADLAVNSGTGVRLSVYHSSTGIASTDIVTGSTLTTVTKDFTAPSGATVLQIYVDNRSPRATTDELVVDNVSVRELYPFEQYNPAEGTIHLEASFPFTPAVGDFTTLLRLEGGSASSDRIDLRVDGTPKIGTQVRANNATTQVAGFGSNVTADELFRVGLAYKEDDFLAASNKLLNATADTSGAIPALQKITFVVIDSNPNAGHLKRVKYFKRRIPEKHLQSLMDPYNV